MLNECMYVIYVVNIAIQFTNKKKCPLDTVVLSFKETYMYVVRVA